MRFGYLKRYCAYVSRFARILPSIQCSFYFLLIYTHLYTTVSIRAAIAHGRGHSIKIPKMFAEKVERHLKQLHLGIASLHDEPIRGLRLKLTQKPKSMKNLAEQQSLFQQNFHFLTAVYTKED